MTIYPPCKHCGANHGMGIEDMVTGFITPMDICNTCLWKDLKVVFQEDQVTLEQDMESTLKVLEERLLSHEKK